MTLHYARKPKRGGKEVLEPIRALDSGEEDALRRVKDGGGGEDARELYLRTLRFARNKGLWILCDCREEHGERPAMFPRLNPSGWISLVNLRHPRLPHAENCVFAQAVDDGDGSAPRRRAPPAVHDDVLDPFSRADKAPEEDEYEPPWSRTVRIRDGPSRSRRPREPSSILRELMAAAGLNTVAGADGHSAPADWLPAIGRAAGEFRVAPGVRASEVLFADPESWATGAVEERLEAAEAVWPRDGRPWAMLCWTANALGEHEIVSTGPPERRVQVAESVVSPTVGRNRIPGPWLVLGVVARPAGKKQWRCLRACAQPIVAEECPIPVESGAERRAYWGLRDLVRDLEADEALRRDLGAAAQVRLEKPLKRLPTKLGPCLPDFLVAVARPGAPFGGHGDPFDPRDRARYIVEVMGFGDPKYERDKAKTHARMSNIGRVFRMEAKQFDAPHDGLRAQRERIGRDIANDLRRRWGGGA